MTPDNNRNIAKNEIESETNPEVDQSGSVSNGKKIISSEEEAKARLAEKRREMKEKKEREAEIERQRLVSWSNYSQRPKSELVAFSDAEL